jgi:hypothetical protein
VKKRKSKNAPATPSRIPEESEVEEEITPPKSKGKGIFGVISGKLAGKRKQEDRSPEEASSSKPPDPRFQMVCVLIPPPPRPYSDYHQLGVVPTSPDLPSVRPAPSLRSVHTEPRETMALSDVDGPSTSPSISSFDTRASGRNFEAERFSMLLNASQEDLRAIQRSDAEDIQMLSQRYQDRERRMVASFEKERTIFRAQIAALERQLHDLKRGGQGRTGGPSQRGEERRRG